jgi:hypothetical protein
MPSEQLKRKLRNYSTRLIRTFGRTNKLPATIIGAEHGRFRKVDRSGSAPNPIANSLKDALELIAPIGTKGIDNFVGCCCEVRSSNQILLVTVAPIRNIDFTDAIRPRTNQIISRCQNCQTVFR